MPSLEPPRHRLPPSAFDVAALDRMAEFRGDPDRVDDLWAAASARALVVREGRAVMQGDGLALLPVSQAPDGERLLLGVGPHGPVFAVHPAEPLEPPRARGIRSAAAHLSEQHLGLFMHAVALTTWHENHPCCPRCGSATDVVEAGYARRCRADGSLHHPRTDPAVIVLVVDGADHDRQRCLLGRQATWPEGRFSTLAGFVEPGESVEQAVAREVAEEVGVGVTQVSYVGSQPWPFPASLMLAYYAVAGDADRQTVTVDGAEIAEARWFTRAELVEATARGEVLVPPRLSVARRLIEGWLGQAVSGAGTWR